MNDQYPYPNLGGGDRLTTGREMGGGQAERITRGTGRHTEPVPFAYSGTSTVGALLTHTEELVGGQRIWITSLMAVVSTAPTTNEVSITIQDGSNGRIVWEEIIGAGAVPGTRVGFIRDHRPLPLSVGNRYILLASASGGTSFIKLNTDGFTL